MASPLKAGPMRRGDHAPVRALPGQSHTEKTAVTFIRPVPGACSFLPVIGDQLQGALFTDRYLKKHLCQDGVIVDDAEGAGLQQIPAQDFRLGG
jgi:hypothetical protein